MHADKIEQQFKGISNEFEVYGLSKINSDSGMMICNLCSDGFYKTGENGVNHILSTGDKKVEFICFENRTLAYVKSAFGYPAYYPIEPVEICRPVKAVLMDLDGTTVKSEEFWIWIIEKTLSILMNNSKFRLQDIDIPFVSGHSVSEHLQYGINKYCPFMEVAKAREVYYELTRYEMKEILEGRGRKGAFAPAKGIKEFLTELKSLNVKIGLVTSGLYEKAYPEIVSAFETLNMGDPAKFYDAIITAGYPLENGNPGTLGELCPKPHPWLYSEIARVGLGMDYSQRGGIIGIEDSGAGVCSIRLANFNVIGIGEGNIIESGTKGLCSAYCQSFEEILKLIKSY